MPEAVVFQLNFMLQVQHTLFDLLGSSLIPELSADVAAGTARHVQLILVGIAAVGAFPDELAVLVLLNLDLPVVAAYLAVITLGIQLRVHDVIVNELHDGQNGFQVILHVGNLHVGDGSSR